ncbi:MAG TPA: acetyl-CoA carboxylase biotin carboxylase subunit [Chloroflexota bacterium]|nr:acetyl-CoA carboxylase biotin carboxylase subunit [Chloroflexota bacterium]
MATSRPERLRKVLVANRGEIAVRIIRACSEIGIDTVAVYSEVDRDALHVRYADEAYPVGPGAARESYLRIDKLIDVAKKSGADAVHPGYGFLSERAEFAEACAQAGIVFIGPSPRVINALGDKMVARRTMIAHGVPVVPGSVGPVQDVAEAERVCAEVGFPVMIKAAAGGGGKGMRVVNSPDELPSALRAAASEARAAFGDGTVYIEKQLDNVRHVEVQLLADAYGNVVHLGERECSIQRRHQKLIEESPSPVVDEELRTKLGEAAITAAKAVGYESAGTVEFLVDRDRNFYFLEVNTRIQVEHPVTELVTGVDLVVEQLRIAAGRRLRYRQEDLTLNGWAIECRISAEDPYNNFMPSTGKITMLSEPSGPGVRVDSGIYEGFEVTLYYDPLLAKLIVWGETRGQAILRMRRALADYKLLGIRTTIPFHLRMMETTSFIAGRLDTRFLERTPVLETNVTGEHGVIAALAAAAVSHYRRQKAKPLAGAAANGNAAAPNPWKLAARAGLRR